MMTLKKYELTILACLVAVLFIFLVPGSVVAQVTFRNPLATVLNPPFSALFDNDGSAVNGAWRDYQCGTLSYDGHTGTDFRAVTNTAVYAGAAGRVTYMFSGCNDVGSLQDTCGVGYGNHYKIDHAANTADGRGLMSIYAHLKSSSVTTAIGTPISCGQQLALSASSGKSQGPHLHFELRTDGAVASTKIDPFKGVAGCNASPGYWTAVSGGIPTTQCYLKPLAPSNVLANNPTASSLNISFVDNALNENTILIERRIGTSGSWSQISSTGVLAGAVGWNFTSTGLSSGTTYCYRSRAQNSSGYSGYSNEACGTTLIGSTLPLAPSNVSVGFPTTNSLQVNFTDNATNETAVLLERKTGTGGAWSQIANFGALNATGSWNWINSGLSSGTTYCYRMRAQNASGYSGYSNEACGTTQVGGGITIPLAPSNVSVTNPTVNSLRVNFKDNATNETSILIERKVGTGSWTSFGSFSALSGASSWYWINIGLLSRTMYCYRFRATNSAGTSLYSNQACGTTL